MAWGTRADTEPRRRELLEVLVFLFLIVPSMLLSFFVVRHFLQDFGGIVLLPLLGYR